MSAKFPSRFGKYILLDRINSGGMAEVYRAKVTGVENFQRLVAIKCMLPSLVEDEQFISMFIDEAKLAAQLTHANIVQIYELGRMRERLYIAMELVTGRDLRHILKTIRRAGQRIPTGFAAYVISKAAEGLDFAHRKVGVDGKALNIVHRDVSPQNILVSYDGEVKVVDFGIAKAEIRATKTQAGVLKGKFAYMSPEQIMGKEIDRRADIFALGIVLFESITGERLFSGQNDLSVLEKVRSADVPDIRSLYPACPEDLALVLNMALARDRKKRYQWAAELAEALEPLLIEDRSIFGAKRAAQFMHSLYATEIAHMNEQITRYAKIGDADCVDIVAPYDTSASGVTNNPKTPAPLEPVSTVGNDVFGGDGDFIAKTTLSAQPASAGGPRDTSTGDDWAVPTSLVAEPAAETDANALVGEPGRGRDKEQTPKLDFNAAALADESPLMARLLLLVLIIAVCGMAGAVMGALFLNQPTPTQVESNVTPIDPGEGPGDVETGTLPSAVASDVGGDPNQEQLDKSSIKPEPDAAAPPQSEAKPPRAANKAPVTVQKEVPRQNRAPPRQVRFGFVSVKTTVTKRAKVYIDGREAGYAPLFNFRARIGRRQVKVVDFSSGQAGRFIVEDVVVHPKNTRSNPALLQVNL